MSRKKSSTDPPNLLERVLSWSKSLLVEGVVGRTQDDCDGDWTQQLRMSATPDGHLHIYCLYPAYIADRETVEPTETEHFIVPHWLEGPAKLLWFALRLDQEAFPQKEAPALVPLPQAEKPLLKLLDALPWPPGLKIGGYSAASEHGSPARLTITVSSDGDVWVWVEDEYTLPYRFRTSFGGGMSIAVRNALVVMAEVIRQKEEA